MSTRGELRPPGVGAFFDMDKTLIAENSGALYLRYRYERGEIGLRYLAQGLYDYLRYKAGILNVRSFVIEAAREFADRDEAALMGEARAFVAKRVVPTLYPEAIERIRWHETQGHAVAIVSGATKFVVEPLAAHLGVRHVLHTQLESEEGRLTGRVVDPVCFEEGKIYWLTHFVEERNIDLAKSWFYTDSVTDLPLLNLVGHPVAVNPDPLLYRAARRRAWPVRLFAAPAP